MNLVAPIYVGQLRNGVVWIRVEGKGSFQNSAELKNYSTHMIEKGAERFVIDLENCPVMDSTFMGTLLGIARSLGGAEESKVEIINANFRNVQLLNNLGLDQILLVDVEGNSWPDIRREISDHVNSFECLDHIEIDKQESAEQVLEAHRELTKADSKNVPRFQEVIEFLEQELHNERTAS